MPKACKNTVEIKGMKNCHIRDAIAVSQQRGVKMSKVFNG